MRQQGQGSASLLKLGQGAPLALKDREGRRMEGIAGLEPAPEKLPCPGLGGGGVHRKPFGGEAGGAFEAPVGVGPGHSPAHALFAEIFEKAAPNHLADLGLVVGNEVAGDAADHLGQAFLPLLVPIGHFPPGCEED